MSFRKPVTVLRFVGPRFEDHGLDVDVLPEIVVYKRLLQETAKEIWRREHPDRQRLPRHYEADVSLKFFSLEPGSTTITLVREQGTTNAQLQLVEDEVDIAASLLENTIRAAAEEAKVPKDLPRNVIPMFELLGSTLRPDKRLDVKAQPNTVVPASFNSRVRENILRWAAAAYQDAVDITGEVRGTDLDGLRFTLRVDDGRKLPGRFRPEQEQLVLEALGEHVRQRLRVQGVGEFGPDGSLQQIVSLDHIELVGPTAISDTTLPIWERLTSIGQSVPPDAWRDVPTDLSSNVDKHLYGRKDSH